MKIIDGLSYREWQKRNTEAFSKLNHSQQKEVRAKGYRNVGWNSVQKSWDILKNSFQEKSVFDYKLSKGDLLGAIHHSILEAEQAQVIANEAIDSLEKSYDDVKKLADEALSKYQLL